MIHALRLIAIVLIVGVAALWFAQSYRGRSTESPAEVGYLPDFSLPDLNDRPRSITEWSGTSLIINFWATWCAPCRREMPLLQDLHDRQYGGRGLQIIGIAMDNLRDVTKFVAQNNITYPILYGEHEASVVAESLAEDFVGLPFSVFVAPDGQILAFWPGEISADELRKIAAELDAVASGRRSAEQARQRLASE
ncbi:MAG: TlpA family protein disulfide reductase [Gammaproteobacteria bacterium]|nr:TlpA family protein disulfide reductase [Gammaproteobacteria bacterium]